MVIEADGSLLLSAGFLRCFAKGTQTGFGGADGGQKSKNAKNHNDPHAQAELLLQPHGQNQEKQHGKDDGKAELAYPHQKIQYFHNASVAKKRIKNAITIPNYYTVVSVKIQDQQIY